MGSLWCVLWVHCVYTHNLQFTLLAFKINPLFCRQATMDWFTENLMSGCAYSFFWFHRVISISEIVTQSSLYCASPLPSSFLSLSFPLPLCSPSFPYCSCRSGKKTLRLLWIGGCDWQWRVWLCLLGHLKSNRRHSTFTMHTELQDFSHLHVSCLQCSLSKGLLLLVFGFGLNCDLWVYFLPYSLFWQILNLIWLQLPVERYSPC